MESRYKSIMRRYSNRLQGGNTSKAQDTFPHLINTYSQKKNGSCSFLGTLNPHSSRATCKTNSLKAGLSLNLLPWNNKTDYNYFLTLSVYSPLSQNNPQVSLHQNVSWFPHSTDGTAPPGAAPRASGGLKWAAGTGQVTPFRPAQSTTTVALWHHGTPPLKLYRYSPSGSL